MTILGSKLLTSASGPAVPGPWAGAYDGMDATPVHAYGLRRLLTSYAGNLAKIRRVDDNATQDFGEDPATGHVDMTAIATFLGASAGNVTRWYDQAGSVDLEHLVVSREVVYKGDDASNRPLGHADTGGKYVSSVGNIPTQTQPYSTVFVMNQDINGSNDWLFSGPSGFRIRQNTTGYMLQAPGAGEVYVVTPITGWKSQQVIYNGASSGYYEDASLIEAISLGAGDYAAGSIIYFNDATINRTPIGLYSEWLLFSGALSADDRTQCANAAQSYLGY